MEPSKAVEADHTKESCPVNCYANEKIYNDNAIKFGNISYAT